MKIKIKLTSKLNHKYQSRREFDRRDYRLEKNKGGSISYDCLRWIAERRYL